MPFVTELACAVWIAAVSRHTVSGVVGPGRELSPDEVPVHAVHGSYARHTNATNNEDLRARRAIHLSACGYKHGRWRPDLETGVFLWNHLQPLNPEI